ncbi:MAG: methionine adenosyltransferase [Mucinivorans sp.]
MSYLFTSESVSEGHPDKVSDQISDAILDKFLASDPNSKVAVETLCTTGLVVVSGEVKSDAYVDIQNTVRSVIERIGYTKAEYMFESNSCGVLSALHEQSPDINQGVERSEAEEQGAGDQGIMFGFATNETASYMPATIMLSHIILQELSAMRRRGEQMTYLRPDAKSQVTIEHSDDGAPKRVHTIVVSTQHDPWVSLEQIRTDVKTILMPRVKERLTENGDKLVNLIDDNYILHVNPTGKFVIGGPAGDTGLTGRKIIVDTYGGRGAHGGGAFSGKDSSKVDRSAAYAVRHIAKNMVAAGIAPQVQIQIAYAIGVARPISVFINTFGKAKVKISDGEIAEKISKLFDLRPAKIVERFGLKNPIFSPTAAYGHFGREPYTEIVDGRKLEFFAWEKLDAVDMLRKEFSL